jgi:precorrin-2 C(20)-methyltransferase
MSHAPSDGTGCSAGAPARSAVAPARSAVTAGRSTGRLWVVGVGPGDPELVSVKAARLIGEADLVCYPRPRRASPDGSTEQRHDALGSAEGNATSRPDTGRPLDGPPRRHGRESADGGPPRLHARDIAAPYLREGQRELAFDLPMSADPRVADAAYAEAAARIAAALEAGRRVVVLTEGDPLFFGSAGQLIEALGARWPVAFVPGISSPNAAAARLGRALTRREDVYKVLSATLPDDRLGAELGTADAAAILKIGRHFDRVRAVCDRLGLTGRAHFAANATRPDEVIQPLATTAAGPKPYFSLILISREAPAAVATAGRDQPSAAASAAAPAG